MLRAVDLEDGVIVEGGLGRYWNGFCCSLDVGLLGLAIGMDGFSGPVRVVVFSCPVGCCRGCGCGCGVEVNTLEGTLEREKRLLVGRSPPGRIMMPLGKNIGAECSSRGGEDVRPF